MDYKNCGECAKAKQKTEDRGWDRVVCPHCGRMHEKIKGIWTVVVDPHADNEIIVSSPS